MFCTFWRNCQKINFRSVHSDVTRMAKTIVKQKIVHGHAWKKVHKNIQQKASQPFPSTNYVYLGFL